MGTIINCINGKFDLEKGEYTHEEYHIAPKQEEERGELKPNKNGHRNLYVKSEVDELVSNGPSADIVEKKGGVA